jgi:hypothetical protein
MEAALSGFAADLRECRKALRRGSVLLEARSTVTSSAAAHA